MKKIKYLIITAVCVLFASCMGDSYAGIDENAPVPYGNNELTETNVITIAQLKSDYATYIATDYRDGQSFAKVTDDVKIKAIVTSSDAQGNIYQELALQDATGAIIVSVAQGGLYGPLPVGTEILVSLKDLYVGNYGKQAQIGMPSKNATGADVIGRISRATWDQHYKILSTGHIVEPTLFATGTNPTTWNLDTDGGKLGIIRNVSFKSSNNSKATDTFADPNGGAGSVSWTLNEQDGRKVIVYNSNFADFANAKVPTGKVDITGIIKRFNNQWEIIIRSLDDIKAVEKVDPFKGLPGKGDGTQANPLDITRALAYAKLNKKDPNTYYIQGVISQIDEVSTQYGNARYYLSNDGSTTDQLQVFRGLYLNGDKFTNPSQISVGKKVLILGTLDYYEPTSNPQVGRNSKIISIN
jgi:putative lipoprotein